MNDRWQIREREVDWYHDCFVNGSALHEPTLPGVDCPDCGDTWGGSRIIPFQCPNAIREEIEFLFEAHGALPVADFMRHKRHWEAILEKNGKAIRLMPGDEFVPAHWRLPSIPRDEVFWPFGAIVVSERIANLLCDKSASGASFFPVVIEQVAALEPTLEPPIPRGGDYDEEWYESVPSVSDPRQCGIFYELLIEHETTPLLCGQRSVRESVCPTCGRCDIAESIDYKREVAYYRKKRILPKECTLDVDIFKSHIFNKGFIISDRALSVLDRDRLQNCDLIRLEVT